MVRFLERKRSMAETDEKEELAANVTPSRFWHPSPYLLLTLTALFWAANWVIGRAMRNDMPPIAMGFWRWSLALLILLPVAAPELRRKWHVVRTNWLTLTLLGLLGAVAFNTLIYVGLQYTEATNGVLFNSVSPVLIILLSWMMTRQRISALQACGVLLSLAGVLTIVARGDFGLLGAFHFNRGDIWLMIAMVLWAFYTIVLQRRPPQLSAVAFLPAMLLLALPFLLPFCLVELFDRDGFALTPAT